MYTEDEIQALKKEIMSNIRDTENEMDQLNKDLEVIRNEKIFMAVCNEILDLKSTLGKYKMQLGLINSGYRGYTMDFLTDKPIHQWKDK
ncbi:hypothetical protein WKH56_20235 [Priestia sp. SB1]|uniref:hypothetical protein n=1 Tax=Priestia sp. SB1 TaxID=3132359 RepID=UPI0031825CB9